MGTNYYVHNNPCKHCGRSEEIHIGKDSHGWKFMFNYNEGKFYKNFDELRDWLGGKTIVDEYGREITFDNFLYRVYSKQKDLSHSEEYPGDTFSFEIAGYEFTDWEFS
jgi:hypothetical protein